ncbi:MAG: cytidine deaminase [Citrobacter freundii]|nr:MAG: cytidine deaminase [Citrobacter freundii]
MSDKKIQIEYEVYNDISELSAEDAALLKTAREITAQAYAPYSNFRVGAAASTAKGIVTGTNQENASYPVGICAERTLLSTASSIFPGLALDTIAVSYDNEKGTSDRPVSPCGMCRQALLEYESRGGKPLRIIMSGQKGEVIVLKSVGDLLPFAFTQDELK